MKAVSTVGLVALAAIGLAAQAPAPAPDAPLPIFKTSVDVARIDVQVTDADGRPIPDLRQDEIRVASEGHARTVVLFQHVAGPRGATYAQAAQRTIASEVSTNRGAPRGHLYVLVFDTHHITPGNEVRARRAAEAFIRGRLQPEDRVAIYSLPGPGAELYFTNDKIKAIAELKKVSGSLGRVAASAMGSMTTYEAYEIARGNQSILSRVMMGYSQASASRDFTSDVARPTGDDPLVFQKLIHEDALRIVAAADEDARQFVLRLSDLMQNLKDYEGRKAVLLFSEGFFTDHITRELEQVDAAAARSYAVVYALDLNSRMNEPATSGPVGGDQFNEIQSRLEPLGSLATATSGELITDANQRLEAAFRRVADQSQDYYIVGFEANPEAGRSDEPYRHLKLTVTRPGAHVSVRTGYAVQNARPRERRSAINLALSAPYSLQGLPIDFTTYTLASDTSGLARVLVSLAADLPVAADRRVTADVVFAVKDLGGGRVVASGTDAIPLPRGTIPGSTSATTNYQVQFTAPPGDYLMRVVVREPGGTIGSADRRFTVRAVGGPGLTAGDMLLRSAGATALPVHVVAYAAEPLTGVVELYGRTPQAVQRASVTLDLVPAGADVPVETTIATLEDARPSGAGVSRAAELLVPPGSVAPGEYVARARVRDANGETIAELQRDVEVRAGHAPPQAHAEPNGPAASPRDVLTGEIARRWIGAFARSTPEVAKAVEAALKVDWKRAEAAVPTQAKQSPAGLALRGTAFYADGNYAAAADSLKESFDADPKNARTAFVLGWARAAAGDDSGAITAWRNAALLEPSLVPAHLALADIYVKLSQPALAAQALRAGLAAVPESPELKDRLARISR